MIFGSEVKVRVRIRVRQVSSMVRARVSVQEIKCCQMLFCQQSKTQRCLIFGHYATKN